MTPPHPTCPRCGAPRIIAPDCPHCGVIYARAEARAARDAAQPVSSEALPAWPPAAVVPREQNGLTEAILFERRLRLWAVPSALVLAFLINGTGAGSMLSRLISGMWLHELGHATAAWMCGYVAVPLPWFTAISGKPSVVLTLMLAAGLGFLAWRSFRLERRLHAAVFAALALLAVVGRFIPVRPSQVFITFFGDGGALVFGALLICTFYVAPGSVLHRGALRWGLMALGALGFANVFGGWWAAQQDLSQIPFGHIEGVGLSDPSKLVDLHGWTERGLVHAYLALGFVCLAAVTLVWTLGRHPAEAPGGDLAALRGLDD